MSQKLVLTMTCFGLVLGCGGDDAVVDENANPLSGGKFDNAATAVCDGLMTDKSGNNFERGFITNLSDPIANFALRGGGDCPTTFTELLNKLYVNDNEGACRQDAEGEIERGKGHSTMVVSETAQAMDTPTDYRLVLSRRCGDRKKEDMVFSLFGVGAGDERLPDDAEIIAWDKEAGVHNYYTLEGGEWAFHGNSQDLARQEGSHDGQTRCAQCHTGGGLIMKELDTPWVHWEGHHDTPGARELVQNNPDLGSKSSGSAMEGLTKSSLRRWNESRVQLNLADRDLNALLKPLFCTTEVNLDNAADFEGTDVSSMRIDFFVDPIWKSFGSVGNNLSDAYEAEIEAIGQGVFAGEDQLVRGEDPVIDTIFKLVFVERAFADKDYGDKLVAAGIIDAPFVKDVLAIDFTRPIWSAQRCEILAFAPKVDDIEGDLNAETLTAAFIASITSAEEEGLATTAALEFKAHLENRDDTQTHQDRVNAYIDACNAREAAPLMTDIMKAVALTRDRARQLHVFEFGATMPFDETGITWETHQQFRFNPLTCEFGDQSEEVPPAEEPPVEEPPVEEPPEEGGDTGDGEPGDDTGGDEPPEGTDPDPTTGGSGE